MRKKLTALLTLTFMLFTYGTVHAIALMDNLPPEVIVLKSPDNSYADWKAISKYVTEKTGVVEYIPSDQKIANWSELIGIQYFDRLSIKKKGINSIKDVMELFQATTTASYPGNEVTWRLIEQNKSDAIYEWILPKPFKDLPPEHEVARVFLTDTGLHRIGFTRKNQEMSCEERERCIKSLRDSVSVVSLEEAKSTTRALSLLDKFKDSLSLGKAFENWQEINTYTLDNGCTMVIRVPPSFTGGYVDECLEVTTMPNLYESSIEHLFKVEKESIREKSPNEIEFSILKRSRNEIIYSFVHPQDSLQVTGIVRTLLSNNGYYSISYKRGLQSKLKVEEILIWKERLETIKISNDVIEGLQNKMPSGDS